jgi:hypothetical protein
MKSLERVVLALAFVLIFYFIVEMVILLLTPKEEIPSETLISNSPARVYIDEEPKRKESSVIIAQMVDEIETIEYEIMRSLHIPLVLNPQESIQIILCME